MLKSSLNLTASLPARLLVRTVVLCYGMDLELLCTSLLVDFFVGGKTVQQAGYIIKKRDLFGL